MNWYVGFEMADFCDYNSFEVNVNKCTKARMYELVWKRILHYINITNFKHSYSLPWDFYLRLPNINGDSEYKCNSVYICICFNFAHVLWANNSCESTTWGARTIHFGKFFEFMHFILRMEDNTQLFVALSHKFQRLYFSKNFSYFFYINYFEIYKTHIMQWYSGFYTV